MFRKLYATAAWHSELSVTLSAPRGENRECGAAFCAASLHPS